MTGAGGSLPCPQIPSLTWESDGLGRRQVCLYEDMLIVQSTSPGFPAHRRESVGSWFVASLVVELLQRAHREDAEAILREVRRGSFGWKGEGSVAGAASRPRVLDGEGREAAAPAHLLPPSEALLPPAPVIQIDTIAQSCGQPFSLFYSHRFSRCCS